MDSAPRLVMVGRSRYDSPAGRAWSIIRVNRPDSARYIAVTRDDLRYVETFADAVKVVTA